MGGAGDIAAGARAALQMQPVHAPGASGDMAGIDRAARRAGEGQSGRKTNDAAIDRAASEFESVFIAQFLGAMFSGIKTDGVTGGGQGEDMFRSLLLDRYAEGIQAQGGIGIAAAVKAQMLKMQEI